MKKLMFAIAMMVAAGVTSAEVSFSYQGALRTAQGEKIPAGELNKSISFRLYSSPTDTGVIWGRKLAVHLDEEGLFNVELSDAVGSTVEGAQTNDLAWVLAENLGKGKSLYIGLDVEGSAGEIRPRQKLLNVPASAFAADVAAAKGDFTVQGVATFNGAVNAKGNMTVSGGLTVAKELTVSGGLTAAGGLTVSKDLTAGGDLKVTGNLTASGGDIIPKGGIIMWSGSANGIPAGWALCDGKNGTPDLRGRFIVGANAASVGQGKSGAFSEYGPGDTGGEEKHMLSIGEVPAHTHDIYASQSGSRNLSDSRYAPYAFGGGSYYLEFWSVPQPTVFHLSGETGWAGGNQAHENRPPYYALCFIMKL